MIYCVGRWSEVKVISSKLHFWIYRYMFIVMACAFFMISALLTSDIISPKLSPIPCLLIGLFLLGIAISILLDRKFIEEVIDHGEQLVFKGSGQTDSVKLSDITSIKAEYWHLRYAQTPALRLGLTKPTVFGSELLFFASPGYRAPDSFWQMSWRNIIEDDLRRRVDKARSEMTKDSAGKA
jgi:hypothetical protein